MAQFRRSSKLQFGRLFHHSMSTETLGTTVVDGILIYPFLRTNLLRLIHDNPEFPDEEGKKILRYVADVIHELHRNDWIHFDVKPNNILVDWSNVQRGKVVTDAVLGDLDFTIKVPEGLLVRTDKPFVHFRSWRRTMLITNDFPELEKLGIAPEHEILTRHIFYFGPLPQGLLETVDNEESRNALEFASKVAEISVASTPEQKLDTGAKISLQRRES
ncbi:hypothetical protein DM02DRAFT_662501 [Periconia macrospinosa]|uniref:Protein kinase domain-containing protein n=1 Tax=Periconia macrospinosa TaxID=97972 RepID=A0A2V1D4B7_9PLEO|nr:hypothetical protein DM02DRAFT_662501 [Periconia macrospinosa]